MIARCIHIACSDTTRIGERAAIIVKVSARRRDDRLWPAAAAAGDGEGGQGRVAADEVQVAEDDAGHVGRRRDDDGAVERGDHGDAVAGALDDDVVLRGDVDGEAALGLRVRPGMHAENLVGFLVERFVAHGFGEGNHGQIAVVGIIIILIQITDMNDIHDFFREILL